MTPARRRTAGSGSPAASRGRARSSSPLRAAPSRPRRSPCPSRSRAPVRASAIASAAPASPSAPPSRSGMPATAASARPGKMRVRERLGAVGEPVEDDPAPERAADRADQRDLEQRAPHDRPASTGRRACRPGWRHAVPSVLVVMVGGRSSARLRRVRLGQLDQLAAVASPRSPRCVSVSSGGPNATRRRLRHSTASQRARLLDVVRRDHHAPALATRAGRSAPSAARRLARRRPRTARPAAAARPPARARARSARAGAGRRTARRTRDRRARAGPRRRAPRARRSRSARPGRRHQGSRESVPISATSSALTG